MSALSACGAGDIDVKELHVGVHMLGLSATNAQARKLLARFDTDRNGRLELSEFRQLVAELRRFQESMSDEISHVFHRFDRDRSGSIDVAELRAALYAIGLPADTAQAVAILCKFDADQNGVLELDEVPCSPPRHPACTRSARRAAQLARSSAGRAAQNTH